MDLEGDRSAARKLKRTLTMLHLVPKLDFHLDNTQAIRSSKR